VRYFCAKVSDFAYYLVVIEICFSNRDLKTQNVFMKKKGNICKIGENLLRCDFILFDLIRFNFMC